MKQNKRELERDIKRLKKIQTAVDDIMRKEKALARKRSRRWLTKEEKLEITIHYTFMQKAMEQIQRSLKK